MGATAWAIIASRFIALALRTQGLTQEAGYLDDLAAAATAGKNVDRQLQEAAERWAAEGPPSHEELKKKRDELTSLINA